SLLSADAKLRIGAGNARGLADAVTKNGVCAQSSALGNKGPQRKSGGFQGKEKNCRQRSYTLTLTTV
ncbi:MAG: hypothetical protein ACI33O_12570, partial [Bhargavaea sp.]